MSTWLLTANWDASSVTLKHLHYRLGEESRTDSAVDLPRLPVGRPPSYRRRWGPREDSADSLLRQWLGERSWTGETAGWAVILPPSPRQPWVERVASRRASVDPFVSRRTVE